MAQRTVLVTGAAHGIGRATARWFAERGWRVGAFDVDTAALSTLAPTLGESAVTGRLDVTSPEDWQVALEALTEASGGRLDVLVNNAGLLRGGELVTIPLEQQHAMIEVNVKGVLNGCYAAHPHLAGVPGATVVNLCSASAIYGQAELASYSASKFAVRGLSEALDLEWRKDGVHVRAIWPLFVDTAMTDGLDIGSTRSLGVRLTAEDVAAAIYDTAVSPDVRVGGGGVGPRKRRAQLDGPRGEPAAGRPLTDRPGRHGAPPAGLEPATIGLEGRRSIH